jgi:TRAP-type mannitol/chloroaromatic compound transport system permease small subunit
VRGAISLTAPKVKEIACSSREFSRLLTPHYFNGGTMRILNVALDIVDTINEWCGRIFGFALVLLVFVVVYEVVMRYLFNRPTIWGMEISQMLMLISVCLGVGYTFLHSGHVKITILQDSFSSRTKAVIDGITYFVVLICASALIWYGFKIFWQNLIFNYHTSSAFAPPQWPAKMLVPVGGGLLALQCVAKLVRDWTMALKGKKLQSRWEKGEAPLCHNE